VAWNHSTHYFPWVLRAVEARLQGRRAAAAIDVGSGDGEIAARLTSLAEEVVGLDADAGQTDAARERHAERAGLRFETGDVLGTRLAEEPFDIVTCVACLHHLDLAAGLTRLKRLTAPGGVLVIVGLARDAGAVDRLRTLVAVPVSSLMRRLRGWHDHGAPVREPEEDSAAVRRAVAEVLPGARFRRRLYWRYSVEWQAPATQSLELKRLR